MSNIWIGHKHILYADLRRLLGPQVIGNLEELAKIMTNHPTQVRLLVNGEDIVIDPSQMRDMKRLGKIIFASKALETAAIVATGEKGTLLQVFNEFTRANVRPFRTEREALDWFSE